MSSSDGASISGDSSGSGRGRSGSSNQGGGGGKQQDSSEVVVVRMDADDVMEPSRLWNQLQFLACHQCVAAVGGAITLFSDSHHHATTTSSTKTTTKATTSGGKGSGEGDGDDPLPLENTNTSNNVSSVNSNILFGRQVVVHPCEPLAVSCLAFVSDTAATHTCFCFCQ